MNVLVGWATPEGTTRYHERFRGSAAPDHFRNVHDKCVSSLGIGTYLGQPDAATDKGYKDAVIRAVQLGVNVIDTAANYRFQRSERSIGQAMRALAHEYGFAREEIVVCTKGGYLPFESAPPRDVRSYIEETFVRPGIAGLNDFVGGSHCMTPRYLQNQLERSLDNLGLNCIDVYYVHNPESQLGFVSSDEFYSRLRQAFEFLERSIADGKLGNYGVATWNGFRVPENSGEYHSLERLVEQARTVGGESHGFRFIQLPYNLAMPEGFTIKNQVVDGKRLSILEAADALGITVVASASLLQGRVASQLPAGLREGLRSPGTDAQTAIQFVRSTPGITTALIGMSRKEHVEENLQLAGVKPLPRTEFLRLFAA